MLQGNFGLFQCCPNMKAQISPNMFPSVLYAEKLCAKFAWQFTDFEGQKCRLELQSNPFAVNMESAPIKLQMELIELQFCDTLKSMHDTVGAAQFLRFIPDTMPQIHARAAQMLTVWQHISM